MPELFRYCGFVFFFFSREHEPIHIHVEGNGGKVIFDIEDGMIKERDRVNLKTNDLKRIRKFVEANKEIIIDEWNLRFGGKEEADNEDNQDMV
ncbi:MAG: DUF4160 domain-containing protein [Bacteroidales bacterium]|nr:DUF4160 domain-containing protein [Bacteroidales bacterium]